MMRLTKHREDGIAWYNHQPEKSVSNDELLARLAAYEDTGLEPEEIVELIAENKRLHNENFWLTHGGGKSE